MKTSITILSMMVLSSFIFMGGCLEKLTTVNFDYTTEAVFNTESHDAPGDYDLGETTLTSGLKEELSKNGTDIDNLDELMLKSAEVVIENPSQNFDNISKLELYISADGSPEIIIASSNPVPKGANSVALTVNSTENLMNYIKATTFSYRIAGTTTGKLEPMKLTAKAIWKIKASAK
jgi:hypothetical protein